MPILPTWDLFITVFFAIIVAYSFIVGRGETLKIIISTYIAVLAADSIVNMIDHFLLAQNSAFSAVSPIGSDGLIILKILIFVFAVLLITVRGNFSVATGHGHGFFVRFISTGIFGFLSAGLIVSTILVYVGGGGFVGVGAVGATGLDLTTDSYLAKVMTENYNLWFSLPAIAFVVASFFNNAPTTSERDE